MDNHSDSSRSETQNSCSSNSPNEKATSLNHDSNACAKNEGETVVENTACPENNETCKLNKCDLDDVNYSNDTLDLGNPTKSDSEDCQYPNCSNCVQLQGKLRDEQKRCTILRANIHKVSANWFQRKTQISESELDIEVHPVSLLDETTRIDGEDIDDFAGNNLLGSNDDQQILSSDYSKLIGIITQKSAQLDLSDNQCHDLKKRMREYEQIIDDKEDIIHGLKDQLETYLTDNQNMIIQLNNLAALFQQLEKVEKETVVSTQTNSDDAETPATTVPLPTEEEFKQMASSVSRTYIRLKDLIYEKKALVTEIERLNTLNVELQRRVVQQETRLLSVSDALHQTWLVVSDLKDDHAKLHNDELIMRYELKEKRAILTKLRDELESARAQWQVIRQKNLESEQEYASIREMLQERRRSALEGVTETEVTADEPAVVLEPDEALRLHPDDAKSFDPPVDLLLEMGLEYGIIGEEAEMTQTVLDVIGGEDIRNNRLEQLEEHCSLLYQKLIASTSRSLSLASRLSRLHQELETSDDEYNEIPEGMQHFEEEDEDEIDTEDEEEVQYFTDENHLAIIESVLSSPESEEYDTAYVSETDGAELQTENHNIPVEFQEVLPSPSTEDTEEAEVIASGSQIVHPTSESSDIVDMDESCDHLSRTLINFLPKKIEFLKTENKRLELNINQLKEDKTHVEDRANNLEKNNSHLEEELKILKKDVILENIQRKQLEEQLKHLGKCVDELKLKHQAEVSSLHNITL